jgi:alginate O-acetyltransferase complex protein AlgI
MEYLYILLGGSRKGRARTYVNLMIVMLLGGLWHGAAWSYAIWGTFHGAALAIERIVHDQFRIGRQFAFRLFGWVTVFSFVTLAWLLFKLPKFEHVLYYFRAVADNTHLPVNQGTIIFLGLYSLPIILYHALSLLNTKNQYPLGKVEYLIYGFMLFLIITNSGSPGEFIYFQF